jgi:methylmalonyl-CoA mutase
MTEATANLSLAASFPPATREAWVALVEKAIKGADFEKRLVSRTLDGLRIEPLYTRADGGEAALAELPGAAPFTRGGARRAAGAPWDIRALHIQADPAAANKAILEDLEGGATSIKLQIAAGGGMGLAAASDALGAALDGVLLDVCPVHLAAFEAVHDAAAALGAVWQARGIAAQQRLGGFGGDPLGTLALAGGLADPLETALSQAANLVQETLAMPGVTALTADGHPYQVAGASEAQELAAMLSTLVAYLRACEAAGIPPAAALPKIAIALAADADQFLTIAKLRAGRRLVWRVAEACGAGDAAGRVQLQSTTSYRMMAKRDPWTNILRSTIACAAAAFGGADAITVLPFTIALGQPDRFARRIARNIQIVAQEESNLGRVADPAGGSWYIENLTDDLAKAAWSQFQAIEAKGGMAAALAAGYVQDEIAKTAAARDSNLATGRMELTGVSAFPLLGPDGVNVEPWPKAAGGAAPRQAVSAPALRPRRLAEPFEALRDAADAYAARTGAPPRVFLASLGAIADHTARSTWIKNYLAAGGIEALSSDGFASAEEAAAAFRASGARAACICSSDAIYAAQAEGAAQALKAAGAGLVLMAGRPGEREASLKAAGVDRFLFAGADAIATLEDLQAKLMA